MESRKMVPINLFTGQQWRNRHREQTYGHKGRGEEGQGEMYGESNNGNVSFAIVFSLTFPCV